MVLRYCFFVFFFFFGYIRLALCSAQHRNCNQEFRQKNNNNVNSRLIGSLLTRCLIRKYSFRSDGVDPSSMFCSVETNVVLYFEFFKRYSIGRWFTVCRCQLLSLCHNPGGGVHVHPRGRSASDSAPNLCESLPINTSTGQTRCNPLRRETQFRKHRHVPRAQPR